ncbi:MAG TPA: AMP-dependent synthetase, partial [Intrasporangium sp.]|nr:AMP-dependent synthetase [Intrasporangium sp.]
MRLPRPFPVPAGPDVLHVLPDLERALAGDGALLPYAEGSPRPVVSPSDPADLPDDLAVAVGTSGSTGRAKR